MENQPQQKTKSKPQNRRAGYMKTYHREYRAAQKEAGNCDCRWCGHRLCDKLQLDEHESCCRALKLKYPASWAAAEGRREQTYAAMERRAELARGRYAKKVALKKRREKCTKFDIKQKRALKKPFVKEDNWWCRVEGCERFFDTAQKSYQHKSRVHRGFFEKRFEVFCDSD